MTKLPEYIPALTRLGIAEQDALALRKIAMILHRWYELECGIAGGGLEQDETTGKWWWYSSYSGKRTHTVADREAGAKRRLARIMQNYPDLVAYIQTDPRGAALYIIPKSDVPVGARLGECYNRGVAVYK